MPKKTHSSTWKILAIWSVLMLVLVGVTVSSNDNPKKEAQIQHTTPNKEALASIEAKRAAIVADVAKGPKSQTAAAMKARNDARVKIPGKPLKLSPTPTSRSVLTWPASWASKWLTPIGSSATYSSPVFPDVAPGTAGFQGYSLVQTNTGPCANPNAATGVNGGAGAPSPPCVGWQVARYTHQVDNNYISWSNSNSDPTVPIQDAQPDYVFATSTRCNTRPVVTSSWHIAPGFNISPPGTTENGITVLKQVGAIKNILYACGGQSLGHLNGLEWRNGTYANSVGSTITDAQWDADQSPTGNMHYGSHAGSSLTGYTGTLKFGDLTTASSIRHAIALNVPTQVLECDDVKTRTDGISGNETATGNQGGHNYFAPNADATGCDYTNLAGRYGSSNTNSKLGQRLAIPPSFDCATAFTFTLSNGTKPGRLLCQAMKDYGVISVDTNPWASWSMNVTPEESAAFSTLSSGVGLDIAGWDSDATLGTAKAQWRTEIESLYSNLVAVTNDAAGQSTAGGGIARDCFAPPFSDATDPAGLPPDNLEPAGCPQYGSSSPFDVKAFLSTVTPGSAHEGIPHGVPLGYSWQSQAITGKDSGYFNKTGTDHWSNEWGQIYADSTNVHPANTRVEVKNCSYWILPNTGGGGWTRIQPSSPPGTVAGGLWTEDFTTSSGSLVIRSESDGGQSIKPVANAVNHFWTTDPFYDTAFNVKDAFVVCSTRLVLDNPSGTDDRASAKYLINTGADWRVSNGSCPIPPGYSVQVCDSLGQGKMIYVTNNWRAAVFSSMTTADIAANPAPPASAFLLPDGTYPGGGTGPITPGCAVPRGSGYVFTATATDATGSPNEGVPAQNIQDGDETGNATRWISTATAVPQYLNIDLGSDKVIASMDMLGDPGGAQPYNFSIQTATAAAPSVWTTRVPVSGYDGLCVNYSLSNVTARYLRLNITARSPVAIANNYNVSVREIRINPGVVVTTTTGATTTTTGGTTTTLAPTTTVAQTLVTVTEFYDTNSNGVQDSGEVGYPRGKWRIRRAGVLLRGGTFPTNGVASGSIASGAGATLTCTPPPGAHSTGTSTFTIPSSGATYTVVYGVHR